MFFLKKLVLPLKGRLPFTATGICHATTRYLPGLWRPVTYWSYQI